MTFYSDIIMSEIQKEEEQQQQQQQQPSPHPQVEAEEPSPTPVPEEKNDAEASVLTPPQITISNNNDSEPAAPELTINGDELILDEPQTPVPTDASIMSESTIPDETSTTSSHSTLIPESLHNDDTQPIHMDESDFQGPVIDFYRNKNILMTGATGFIGKAILWKLIQALRQDLGSVYILIRSGSIKRSKIGRPSERLRNEIFNNKVSPIERLQCGRWSY